MGLVAIGGIEAAFWAAGLNYRYWDKHKQQDVTPLPCGPPLEGYRNMMDAAGVNPATKKSGGFRFGGVVDCRGDTKTGRFGDRRGNYAEYVKKEPPRSSGCQTEGMRNRGGGGAGGGLTRTARTPQTDGP